MQQKIIETKDAPGAIGPYVQGRVVGSFLFTSGQIALDPVTGTMVGEDIATQTRQVLKNLINVIQASGGDVSSVVKNTIFLKDMNHFATVNEIYGGVFSEHKPARSCVEVARLPKDALIEIESIAFLG